MNEFHLADREPVRLAIEAANRATTIEELYAEIKAYRGLEIAEKKPFSPGQPTANKNPIMLICQKPEPEDEETGHPLSGVNGGVMKNTLLEIGIRPEDLHLAYAIHWTPDDDKAPNNTQIAASRPFLFKEIELVQPRVILAPGRHVINALTNYRGQITPLLGNTLQYKHKKQTLQAYVTNHPAYLHRMPNRLPEFISDIKTFFESYGSANDNTLPGKSIPRNDTATPTGIQGIFLRSNWAN